MGKAFLLERKTEILGEWREIGVVFAENESEVLTILKTRPEKFVVSGEGKIEYIISKGVLRRECRIVEIPREDGRIVGLPVIQAKESAV